MKKLIEKWRTDESDLSDAFNPDDDAAHAANDCANELQSFIDSLWTEITEDEASWPEGDFYLWDSDRGIAFLHNMRHFEGKDVRLIGDIWRSPIEGIDTP